jgi:predicted nucleotide-binding protein (sugar kinase/HSP70/actin superfamily)
VKGKIGIIRALLYYRYGELFVNFFKNLRVAYLLSPKTNKEIIDLGVKHSSAEVCLPLKVAVGHLLYLKNKVNYLFLPQFVYPYEKLYPCPKMLGLGTIALAFYPQNKLLSFKIKGNLFFPLFLTGLKLKKDPLKVILAYLKAKRKAERKKISFDNKHLKVAIISHFYNIYDEAIGSVVIETFKKEGFVVYLKEDLGEEILRRKEGFSKKIKWAFERELYNAFKYYLEHVDGLCFFYSFACGPDSLIGEMMEREAKEKGGSFFENYF